MSTNSQILTVQRYQFLMLSLPKCKVFLVAEAYWPDPPSPTGENFLSFIHRDDLISAVLASSHNSKMKGKYLIT